MNDEPASSSATYPPPPRNDGSEAVPTAAQLAERRKRNRNMFNRKRGDFLDDLLAQLDMLVYAELSFIYYLDCYFLRFFMRAFVQLVFLTPKALGFPDPPSQRPYIGGILGSNILCFILHAFGNAPSAGEATRGYLHGGLAMDFIGQKGPTSKLLLLLLDLVVLALQITHLSAHLLRQKLMNGLVAPPAPASATDAPAVTTSRGQDLDDEERGIRHSVEQQNREDVEMQTLNASGSAAETSNGGEGRSSEHDALLASTAAPAAHDTHMFDAFSSGQVVLADLDLLRTVKDQFLAYHEAPVTSGRMDFGANRAMGERLANHVLRWRFGGGARGGQTLGGV